nr:hypothetical protein [Mycoplasma haemocanis]
MATIKEDKSLKSKEFDSISEIFERYKIDQYFWRSYKDTPRVRGFRAILAVGFLSVMLAIALCHFLLP